MGIGSWWQKLRARDDEATIERAVERQDETPAERRYDEGGWRAEGADEQAVRRTGEPTVDDFDRIGDGDDV